MAIEIEVESIVEHKDGGATYVFTMNEETSKLVSELGLKFLLYSGMLNKSPKEIFSKLEEEIDALYDPSI